MQRDHPCSFVVYLVAQGIHGYHGGDFWGPVIEVTNFNRTFAWQVGQTFEEILESLGLPLFYDMRAERAHRYVSLILAHGGIPTYCLPDFFANMLQPSVIRAQYADMSAADLIEEWLWHASGRYFTDKPVLRFLSFGGQVAQDLVERCREMAWEYIDTGSVPDAEAFGLPRRVVDAYRQWIAEQDAKQVRVETAERWRLRKPEILIDPWGEGVILDLPPQQVPATMAQADFIWRVNAGEEEHDVPVRVRRTGYDLRTTSEALSLNQPAALVEVSLLVDDQVKRTWRYPGVDDEHPLLVFDPERSTLFSWQYSLPARPLGILYPAQFELQPEGSAKLVEELPRLPWGWSGFRGGIWNLSQATSLSLLQDGKQVLAVPLRPDESLQRPHLVGGQLFSESSARAPVYVGAPPCLRVPLRLNSPSPVVGDCAGQTLAGQRELDEELGRWRLTVRNKWQAIPEINLTTTLAALRPQLTVGEGYVDLPLSLPSLLRATPFGNYTVRLRGPLGRDAEFTLRLASHLVIHGHETLYLPDARLGSQPVTLLVETSPGDGLEWQGEGENRVQLVQQDGESWLYQVELAPDSVEIELTIVRSLPSGEAVRVPITVPVRRLRWALVGEQAGVSRREWTGRILKQSVDAVSQTLSPCLLIELPLLDNDRVHLDLRLLDVDSAELQSMRLSSLPRDQRIWRFDLAASLDTMRASRSPVLRFELVAWNLPERDGPLRLPVLSLTRTLIVDNVEFQFHVVGQQATFELRWCEPTPLKHRCVRFWPLWRPWDPPFEQSISDTAEGVCAFEVKPNALRSGKYRLEFFVADPWVSQDIPQRPTRGTPGTADVELITPAKQLDLIDARLEQGQSFDLLLERAAIYQDIDRARKAQPDWQWCFEHLDEGTVSQILALAEIVQSAGDPDTHRALHLKMFAPHRVERLLQAHRQGNISSDHFRLYLAHMPRSELLPKDTCKHLLSVEEERVRLYALQQLIQRGSTSGVDTVLEWVQSARLSDADAIALLSVNPNFAAECLQKRLDDPMVSRLVDGLGRTMGTEGVACVGDWIHGNVGWGRIERIENACTHAEIRWAVVKQGDYRFLVMLRPAAFAERIVIDMDSGFVRFEGQDEVLICSVCGSFMTQRTDAMRQHFQTVHPARSKKEQNVVRYRRRPAKEPIPLQGVEFTSKEPPDQLA
ncbi:MAG: hypothetical protein JW850_04335 [Thermoflexales bacterium]|nr:hypothetical protein [Thermoflexales bacterium]